MVSRRPSPGLEIFNGRGRHSAGYRLRRTRFLKNFLKVLLVPIVVVGLIAGFRVAAFTRRGSKPPVGRCGLIHLIEITAPERSLSGATEELARAFR